VIESESGRWELVNDSDEKKFRIRYYNDVHSNDDVEQIKVTYDDVDELIELMISCKDGIY